MPRIGDCQLPVTFRIEASCKPLLSLIFLSYYFLTTKCTKSTKGHLILFVLKEDAHFDKLKSGVAVLITNGGLSSPTTITLRITYTSSNNVMARTDKEINHIRTSSTI